MTRRKIALYATDTMADWEYAYLTTQIAEAEAARPGHFELVLVGDGLEPVTSLGGLPLQPSADVGALADDGQLAALVIPGGNHYGTGHERLVGSVGALLARGVPVAAICGATFLLARAGFLDARRHTSNDPAFLGMSGYSGGENYVAESVVTDQGLTTASGVRPVQFTAEVMRRVDLCPEAVIAAWENLNITGKAEYFYELMEVKSAWQNS